MLHVCYVCLFYCICIALIFDLSISNQSTIVRLPHPRSRDYQDQETFWAPSADKQPATMTQSAHNHAMIRYVNMSPYRILQNFRFPYFFLGNSFERLGEEGELTCLFLFVQQAAVSCGWNVIFEVVKKAALAILFEFGLFLLTCFSVYLTFS